MPLFRGTGGSGESSTDAYASEIATEARTASSKANEAAASAASALAAQTAAEAAQAASETAQTNAETAETNAETAETNAETAENAAVSAKTSAETAKTASETAQSAAEVAKTAAETAETNAETAETNASASATTATTKATEAATSATSAATSATTATTKASEAATSATAAQTAQTAAEAAQTAAEAAQEAIDGLYLGTATSNPTVDLNGNAVTAGDWYFNTTDNTTRIYDGSTWNTINPDLVGDSSPQLGGNLDLNSNDITGTGNVNITGNVTLSGTVDGRDVAADGTKLDGIEASATADQTAAEIRTLVDSATDSNVFTDADHSKLDGIEAGATADQTAAEIRTLVESATDSNVFTDADHTKLNGIEASADVTDTANVTAAGALMDSELTSEASVKALNQGVATTDSPTFAGATVNGNVDFVSTDASSSAGPEFTLFRNSASPADGDYLGQIKFDGKSDTGTTRLFAKITGKTSDVTNGTEDGLIETAVKSNGSNVIVSRQTGTALKLINGVSLEVAGTVTASGGTSTNWNTAYGWGDHSAAGYTTGNETITLTGAVTGSGTTSIATTLSTIDGGTY